MIDISILFQYTRSKITVFLISLAKRTTQHGDTYDYLTSAKQSEESVFG